MNMDKKEDRRITKTKQVLKKSLIELMKEKKLSEITVKEVAALADVNRGTFYLHYQDIYDMTEKIEGELFNDLKEIMSVDISDDIQERVLRLYENLFEYIKKNAEMCKVFLSENGNPIFVESLRTVVKSKCMSNWAELFDADKSIYYEAYSSFIVGGCVSLIHDWVNSGTKESPEYMANLAYDIIIKGSAILAQ